MEPHVCVNSPVWLPAKFWQCFHFPWRPANLASLELRIVWSCAKNTGKDEPNFSATCSAKVLLSHRVMDKVRRRPQMGDFLWDTAGSAGLTSRGCDCCPLIHQQQKNPFSYNNFSLELEMCVNLYSYLWDHSFPRSAVLFLGWNTTKAVFIQTVN